MTLNRLLLMFLFTSTIISFALADETKNSNAQNDRLQAVKEMTKSAWKAYKAFAWGKEMLAPLSNSSTSSHYTTDEPGKSLIASLSTLKIMGLEEEFNQSRQWIADNWKFDMDIEYMSFYDQVNEYLGAFLSAYALSGDRLFLDKATEIVDSIDPVYNTSTGLPMESFNPKTKVAQDNIPPLNTIGGTFLEFIYYASVTGKDKVKRRVKQARNFLKAQKPSDGIYEFIEVNGTAEMNAYQYYFRGVDFSTNAFYRALLLSYIQSNDTEGLQMYSDAMEALIRKRFIYLLPNNKVAVHWTNSIFLKGDSFFNWYVNCYIGGLMSLGAEMLKRANYSADIVQRHSKLGLQIAEDCNEVSTKTATKLGPYDFFPHNNEAFRAKHYCLTPELAETNFILWRLTGDEKYRERAWQMVQAINKNAKTASGGFAEILDVTVERFGYWDYMGDKQPTVFLSATLKFLYLTFADSDTLPLDKWVFNEAGHALPA